MLTLRKLHMTLNINVSVMKGLKRMLERIRERALFVNEPPTPWTATIHSIWTDSKWQNRALRST